MALQLLVVKMIVDQHAFLQCRSYYY